MAENRALSQWEIDALLNQIPASATGDVESPGGRATADRAFARVIKAYDFRRPDKFSKEQWATLQSMHEQFARQIGAAFSSRLRTLVTVRLSSIDQGLYEEWQSQVPGETVCCILSMRPLDGNCVVQFTLDVASEVIDRLLGGTGVMIPKDREVGEVEAGLLRAFARSITHALEEMWMHVHAVEPQVQDIGFDPSLIQVASPTDVVLISFFEVSVGNQTGAMSICLPYQVIEPIAAQLSAQVWISNGSRGEISPEQRAAMHTLIQRSRLPLSVRLGDVDVSAEVLMDLQEGDTFVLETRLGRALEVFAGDRLRFTALPATAGNHLAVQIVDVVEEQHWTAPVALLPAPEESTPIGNVSAA